MFKKLLEHNITIHDEQFFCHLCMIIQSDLENIVHHVAEEKHQLLQSELTNNVLEDCKEQTRGTLVDNNIAIITLSSFYCIVCQCNFKDLISTLLHVQGKYHIEQLKKNYIDINYNKDKSKTCIISLISKLLREKEKELASIVKNNLNVFKECHEVQFLRTLHNYSNEDCKILVYNGILKVKYYRLICQYCYQCYSTLDDILQHVKATKHAYKTTKKDMTLNKQECKQNKHIFVNSEVMKNTINLNLSKVKQTDETIIADMLQHISTTTQQTQDTNISEILFYNNITCTLCTCPLPSVDHILQHIKGRQHVNALMYNNKLIHRINQNNNENKKLDLLQEVNTYIFMNNKIIIQGSNFICTLCAREIDSLHDTLQHIEGKLHTKKLKYLDKNSNTSKNEFAQSTNSNSDSCAIQEVNTRTFSEKLEIKDSQSNLKSNIDYKVCSSSHTKCLKKYDHVLVSNKIIIQGSIFICTLCAREIDSLHNTLQHIEGKLHINNLKYIDKNPNTSKNEYALCTNSNSDSCAIQEVNTRTFSEKLEIKDSQSHLKSNIDYKVCSSSNTKCLKKYDHVLVSNKIIIQGSNFICTLCARVIDSLHNTLQHIEGKLHINNLKYIDKNPNTSKNEYALCTNSNSDSCAIQEVNTRTFSEKLEIKDSQSHLKSNIDYKVCSSSNTKCLKKYDHVLVSNKIIIQGSNFICTLCARVIDSLHNTLQHIEGKFHTNKLNDLDKSSNISKIEYVLSSNFNSDGCAIQSLTTNFLSSEMKEKVVTTIETVNNNSNSIIFNEYLYYCELCDVQINIKNINKHIDTLIHKNNILRLCTGNDTLIYKCFCCKSITQGTSLLINHLSSTKHLNNLTNTLGHIKANNIEIFVQSLNNTQNMLKDTKSVLDSVIFPKIANVFMNLSEKQFIFFDVSNMVYNNIKNTVFYFCLICSTTLDINHNANLSCSSFPAITDNDSIIPNDINAEMMKLICNSPFKTKRYIFEELKPMKHLNKMYSEMYLEIEEIMYTVDRRKLDNIKLNFEPFMPCSAEQFFCLACNTSVSKDLDLLYEHACLEPHKIKVYVIKNDKNNNELLKQYMQKTLNNSVKCCVCKSHIKNDTDSIDAHINDNMHKKKCTNVHVVINNIFNSVKQILNNLWYSIQKFSCVRCLKNFKGKIEFIEHIITVHDESLLYQMFDFCIPCATLWINESSDCYTKHCNDIMHKYLIKNKDFMIEDIPECIKKLLRQVDKTSDILSQETQILVNDNTHKEIIQSLKNTLHSSFPFIEVYLFGSRTGLGSTNSIIDIFLDSGNMYYSDHKEWLQKGNLEIIEEIISKQTNEWEVKKEIGTSRTVMKLLYKRTREQCDIFITNNLSVLSFQLIRFFNKSYPSSKKLILFIEKWFSCFDLPSMHGLSNHAIAWLVIFYLQVNSDLPSIVTLIKQTKTRGLKDYFAQPKDNNKSMQSVFLLLLGFFQFYANFDYQHYIICPFMGYAVTKRAFLNLDTLPKEMKPYMKNPEYLRIDSPLCVQGSLDLSYNLTKAVNIITLKYFKQYCQDSAFILQQSSMKEIENTN